METMKMERSDMGAADNSGFTIMEVMIAMVILAVGMLGIASLQISATKSNGVSGASSMAYNLAQQYMEQVLNTNYTDPNLADANAGNNADLLSTTSVDYQNVDMSGSTVDLGGFDLIINVADDNPISNTKTVVVIITWQNGQRSRSISCIKSLAG